MKYPWNDNPMKCDQRPHGCTMMDKEAEAKAAALWIELKNQGADPYSEDACKQLIAAALEEAGADTRRLDWLETECALFDMSIGQEEFSERFVLWSDETTDPAWYGETLREAIDTATKAIDAAATPTPADSEGDGEKGGG